MNQPRFVISRAVKRAVQTRIGLVGPAGSGKTYTALAMATGLVERDTQGGSVPRILLIDTEAESSKKYAGRFCFDHLILPDHSPSTYADAIDYAAGAEQYDVLIVDSLSHAWIGREGALEQVDKITRRSRSSNSFTAWADVTPQHRRMIDTILSAPFHVIATMRAKTEYVLDEVTKGGRTMQVPRKVGMAPVQRDGMEYEFDVVGDLTDTHEWIISKTRLLGLQYRKRDVDLGVIERPGEDLGAAIRAWCSDGETPEEAAKRDAAARVVAEARAQSTEASEVLDGLELVRSRWLPASREASRHMGELLAEIIALVAGEPTRHNARYLSGFKNLEKSAPYGAMSLDTLESDTMVELAETRAAEAHARYLLVCYAYRYSRSDAERDALVDAIERVGDAAVELAREVWSLPDESARSSRWRELAAELLTAGDPDPDPDDGTSEDVPAEDEAEEETPAEASAKDDQAATPVVDDVAEPEPEPEPAAECAVSTPVYDAERGRFAVVPFLYRGPGKQADGSGRHVLPPLSDLVTWAMGPGVTATLPQGLVSARNVIARLATGGEYSLERRASLATLKRQMEAGTFDLDELRATTPTLLAEWPKLWPDALPVGALAGPRPTVEDSIDELEDDADVVAALSLERRWSDERGRVPAMLRPLWEYLVSTIAPHEPELADAVLDLWRGMVHDVDPWRLFGQFHTQITRAREWDPQTWDRLSPTKRRSVQHVLDVMLSDDTAQTESRARVDAWLDRLSDPDLSEVLAVCYGVRSARLLETLLDLEEHDPELVKHRAARESAKRAWREKYDTPYRQSGIQS